jgi:hypothetical protein
MTPDKKVSEVVKSIADDWAAPLEWELNGTIQITLTPIGWKLLEVAKRDPRELKALIDRVDTSPHADMAIREYAANLIEDGREIPAELRKFLSKMLRQPNQWAFRGRKPVGLGNVVRDTFILTVCERLQKEFDIRPTRNPATKRECGCSLAVGELNRRGFKIQESGAAEIWRKRDDIWWLEG